MTTLYYIHDPMCSWCWGFAPVRQQLRNRLPASISWQPLLGGLAADSDAPMPADLQNQIAATWHRIQDQLGTVFNHDFWINNQPRRSTYPACRAVIVAKKYSAELGDSMTAAIQQAYYLDAKNPSDDSTLIELATRIGLDAEHCRQQLNAPETQTALLQEIQYARELQHDGFPSLRLVHQGRLYPITLDYQDPEPMLAQIYTALGCA